jgi:hypothetical protein
MYLMDNPTQQNIERFASWWATLAKHYRGWSHLLAFDLVIEVHGKLNREPRVLNEAYQAALRAIRRYDPCRIVFLAPPHRDSPDYLDELWVPRNDPYVAVEWHFYAAGPSPTNPEKLWTTGTPREKMLILEKIMEAVQWMKKTHIPTWVGAWMPSDYNHGNHYNITEQVKFATFMSCALREAGIPFAVNADQQYYDIKTHQWRRDRLPVVEAILHPNCSETGLGPGLTLINETQSHSVTG